MSPAARSRGAPTCSSPRSFPTACPRGSAAAATYDPDRYLAEPRLASYLHGFGGGTHRCLGEHFAILLTHVVVTRLFQRYELTLADPDPEPVRTRPSRGPGLRAGSATGCGRPVITGEKRRPGRSIRVGGGRRTHG